jgi:hypothetical protein
MRSHLALLRALLTSLAALVLFTALTDSGRGDVVIMKDGFTLIGKVNREGQVIFEGGQAIKVGNGFWVVEDDQTLPPRALTRRIVFPFRQVQDVDDKPINKGPELVILRQSLTPLSTAQWMEPFGPILRLTPFDKDWNRIIEIQPAKGKPMDSKQRVTCLTPYCVVVEASRFKWQMMYLTRELGPEVVRELLYSHPDLKEKPGEVDSLKRTKIVRFLIQAGFYDAARDELDLWLKDGAKDKEKIDSLRKTLQRQRGQEIYDDIVHCSEAAQHLRAQKLLAAFPKDGSDDKLQVQVFTMRDKYEKAEENMALARRYLKELPPRVYPEEHKALFTEAAAAILSELNIDNYQRLERFVVLSKQCERDEKEKQPSAKTPGDLMAMAVSGWLLGNEASEAEALVGVRLWLARKFVREYQKTDSAAARQQLLTAFERTRSQALDQRVFIQEIAQLISLLPPAEPEEKFTTNGVMDLETKLPGTRRGSAYQVQLPREYHHGRPFPVLVVLHQGVEKPADALARWADLAHQHGYILVAPTWAKEGARASYNYSADEHRAVLDAIRDVQRRFNVNSDRVFLTGAGQGGDMAFDVALSHPDVFAGVIPIGAQPRFFAKFYAQNAAFLPFYVVCGELASDAPKAIRDQFKTWVGMGAPTLYVEYKGRGQEWFAGELPTIFDWMGRQKRKTAMPELTQFVSNRTTDDRFYWLSAEGLKDSCINDYQKWKKWPFAQATLQGRIAPDNTIYLSNIMHWQKVAVWINRETAAQPVTIVLNNTTRLNKKEIKPNLQILLEDFYQRGDRQRLFVAKEELTVTGR